jgi:tyrosyl-tRNA synthetase
MLKDIDTHINAIVENSVDAISRHELAEKLKVCFEKNESLKLKIGFDPTARDIHLGHTVLLRKLRKLQELGHEVYLIIGDFTAKIGDPSGKSSLRPVLSDEEIKDNASTYTDQAFKILDREKTKIIYNSVWYKDKTVAQFLSILSSYTVARVLERDDFSLRLRENKPLTMLEIIYPLIQGYDSVCLEADVEFGGTDQKFNLIVGRHLQEVYGQKPQCIVTMPLLVGLDGKNKMSKSLGNYVGVLDNPKDMFGKIMSISDEVMWEYFRLLTDHKSEDAKKMHPKEAKMMLAQTIVSFYHSPEAGLREKDEFARVFSQKELPQDMLVYKVKENGPDLLEVLVQAKIVNSKNEARRLLTQGAISMIDAATNQETAVSAQTINIPAPGIVLKIGKKKFLKIICQN